MSDEQTAPETQGVTVELLATVDLGPEIEGMAGRQLRMRKVTMEPGGVFGPVHDHKGRPGTVYILQGTITDHRDGVATEYGPGVGWPEDRTHHPLAREQRYDPGDRDLGRHRQQRVAEEASLPYGYAIAVLVVAWCTAWALAPHRPRRPRPVAPSFWFSFAVNELPFPALAWLVVVTLMTAIDGSLDSPGAYAVAGCRGAHRRSAWR